MPQHTCNVEMCLRLYYMEVSIYCSALYTPGISQMAEYTLNELMDMHILYGDTADASPQARLECTQPSVMYQLCTMQYNKWKPPCSTNVNTFQHCRYAVAREWIVNANVHNVLIVVSLR